MKSKSLIWKTLLATLVLLVISMPLMSSAAANPDIFALPATTVFMSPTRVQGNAGDTVTVNLMISDVTNLFSFQAGFLFDQTQVNTTGASITIGDFLASNGGSVLSFPGSVDNTRGYVSAFGYTLSDPATAVNGSGTLLHVSFKMKATGFSDVHIIELELKLNDAVSDIPASTIDYSTTVVEGTQYITKLVGNPYYSGMVTTRSPGFGNYTFAQIDKVIGALHYKGEFNFTVTGQGVNGDFFAFMNITIPKVMMDVALNSDWVFQVDGVTQGSRIVTTNATHTTLSLQWTYPSDGSSENIGIMSTMAVPEFPTVFLATLLILATLAAALLGKSTWATRRKV